MVQIIVLLSTIWISVYLTEQTSFLKHDYIDRINRVATTWKAGRNFHPDTPEKYILRLMGSRGVEAAAKSNGPYKSNDKAYEPFERIPKVFDARKKWRKCYTMREVRDQGNCGSCWAFSTTGALADRMCVATNGRFNEQLSVEELAFCCHNCGAGCKGGYPYKAWEYFKYHGVVTGGNYNSSEGCQPYRIAPCLHHQEGKEGSCDSKPDEKNRRCERRCYGDKSIKFNQDHFHTRDAYFLTYGSIQKDVMAYGPIEVSFNVYNDFLHYKSGVYQMTPNATYVGGHSVKLIGWGVERGVDYWLMVNSWGTSWGNNGLFKIRRGTNECGIDHTGTGGVPHVSERSF